MPDLSRLTIALLPFSLLAACGTVAPDPPAATPDAPAACVPETDAELCTQLGAKCGSVTGRDNCNAERTVNCGTCAPVCNSLDFKQMSFITDINATGQQDAFMGVSADGHTVLSQRRAVCSGAFALRLTDGVGGLAVTSDLSSNPGLAQINLQREASVTLTADGLSIIGVTPSLTALAMATRTGINRTDFAPADGGLAAITVTAPAQLNSPVISSDRLELYYQVIAGGTGVDGIYQSVRASTNVPFPAGTRIPDALIQTQSAVTGISSDRRTLFLLGNFGTIVLTRASVALPFSNPNAPAAPPVVPGFRTRPTGDCQTLMGTCTGGCLNEETCAITH